MKAPALLRTWRVERGFSQVEAAKFLGMSQSALSSYETGKAEPLASTALRIQSRTKGKVPVVAWDRAA